MAKLPGGGAPQIQVPQINPPQAIDIEKISGGGIGSLADEIQHAGAVNEQAFNAGLAYMTGLQQQKDAVSLLRTNEQVVSKLSELNQEPFDPLDDKAFGERQQRVKAIFDDARSGWTGSQRGATVLEQNLGALHANASAGLYEQQVKGRDELTRRSYDTSLNNFTNQVYGNPGGYQQTRGDAEHWYDNNLAPALGNPQLAESRKQQFLGSLDFSHADALIESGNIAGAQKFISESNTIGPNDLRILNNKARQFSGAGQDSWSMSADGVLYSKSGQTMLPPPEVQQYLSGLKKAGQSSVNVNVDTKGATKLAEKNSEYLAEDLRAYQTRSREAESAAMQASQIDKLLEGVPTGTLNADIAAQVKRQFGLDDAAVASRETADAATFGLVLEQARKVAPVTGPDIELLRRLTPGSSQTPGGRATLTYVLNRSAEYARQMAYGASKINDKVASGAWTEGEARRAIADVERGISKRMSETFAPPRVQ